MSVFTQQSPGVDFREVDLTNIIGTVGASGGATVGDFAWGPVDEIVTIASPLELQQTFGKPNDKNFTDWFSAFNFLAYTGELKVVRVVDQDAINADDAGSGVLIKNRQHFEVVNSGVNASKFVARYPGAIGNSLAVHVADASNFSDWAYADTFDHAPGTSTAARLVGASNDEIHVVVIDRLGLFTGVVGAVLESYPFLSKSADAKDANNAPNYFLNVINRSSKYVWCLNAPQGSEQVDPSNGKVNAINVTAGGAGYSQATVTISAPDQIRGVQATATVVIGGSGEVESINIDNPGSGYLSAPTITIAGDGAGATAAATLGTTTGVEWGGTLVQNGQGVAFKNLQSRLELNLSAGQDSTTITADELIPGFDFFQNEEEVDVSLIFVGHAGGESSHTAVCQHVIDNIAEKRRDCVAFFSPRLSDVLNRTQSDAVNAVVATRNRVGRSSSYAVMDSGWKLQYDVFNDKYRWLPLNADLAGLCARVDQTNDPWTSPGGYTRGRIKNVVSLAFNPHKTSRDGLYKVGINPVVTFKTDGTILYGDKTLLGKNSAFSQIGIRRLFIMLQKAINNAAKYYLFESNNAFTRTSFVNMVEPYLAEVQGRGGVEATRVVCDETNNTPQIIMNRQFIGDIYIKPTYSINWISLSFVAVRQDVTFEEVVGGTF